MRFLPRYLSVLGAGVIIIGLFDAIKTLLGAVYAYPGGLLSDAWGYRRAMMAFTAVSIAGYVVVLAVPHWGAVLAAMFLFLAWTTLSLPATFSVVAASLRSDQHAMGIGVQSLVRRLPILLGPVAGGLLIDRYGFVSGVRWGVAASIVLAGAALLMQSRFRESAPAPQAPPVHFVALLRSFPSPLRLLLASDILIRFCERIPFAWVVIYVTENLRESATTFGLLTAVEMLAAIICYVPASRLADRYGREPFVLVTFIFFTLFPLSLLMAHTLPLLVVAFAIRGLKEFGEPARKALIISFAPAPARGRVIGAYYLVRDTLVTTGSFIGAALWTVGPRVNFWSAAAIGAAGTLFYLLSLQSAGFRPSLRASLTGPQTVQGPPAGANNQKEQAAQKH